jgi:hypothetical protein
MKRTTGFEPRNGSLEVRSRGLDRTHGQSAFLADGSVKGAVEFAIDALLVWLNGWEPAEKWISRLADRKGSRQRYIDNVHGGSLEGKREYAEDHTSESQARIIELLNYVRSAVDEIWKRAREEDETWVRPAPPTPEELQVRYGQLCKSRGGLPPVDWPPKEWNGAVAELNEPDHVVSFGDMGGRMRRYITFPTLSLHTRSGNFALYQQTAGSEHHRLVELTPEEKAETDPRKRRNYSSGPGVTGPDLLPEELEAWYHLRGDYGKLSKKAAAKWKAVQQAGNRRRSETCTHKWVPPDTPHGEIVAAHSILDLAVRGLLKRVLQCECGTWLYAWKSDQKSCSPECRRQLHMKTETYKKTKSRASRINYDIKLGFTKEQAEQREKLRQAGGKPPRRPVSPVRCSTAGKKSSKRAKVRSMEPGPPLRSVRASR